MLQQLRNVSLALALALAAPTLTAASLTVEVRDQDGAPVEEAVVTLSGGGDRAAPPTEYVMRQSGQRFRPFVLVVPVGASVSFPNDDPVRHHVYSFSPAKSFELKLYGKGESPSVRFDRPGIVAIGCNIHDHMRAYIHVTDAPLFAETGGGGTAEFTGLEEAVYDAQVWHPRLREPLDTQRLQLNESDRKTIRLLIELKAERRRTPADPEFADY